MITRKLVRWGGLFAMVSPVFLVLADVVKYYFAPSNEPDSIWMASSGWSIGQVLITLGLLLLLGGLLGLYSRQAEDAGRLGVIAFLMAFAGTVMSVGFEWYLGFVALPWLSDAAPGLSDVEPPIRVALGGLFIPGFAYLIGWVLFGIASLRAKVFPSLSVWLLILGVVLNPVTVSMGIPVLSEVVLGIGLGWMGYNLWTTKSELFGKPTAATQA